MIEVWPRADAAAHLGVARCAGRMLECALGKGGIRADKREGDLATPSGNFPLRRVLFRADRGPAPGTGLPTLPIGERDGWCDDDADAAYNQPVSLPYGARHERLWREDALYDLVLVIGHNDDPVVPGAGSAVFVHVARPDWSGTEGCIAFRAEDLRWLLAQVGPGDAIRIGAEPRTLAGTP